MKNTDLVSIIIPVHNTAKYLTTCLNSVLTQTYHDIEVILVDDGSYDESKKICKSYQNNDSRVKVVSIPYLGVSVARNIGLDISNGKYITFIDSDDFVATNYIERLLTELNRFGACIAIGMYYTFDEIDNLYRFTLPKRDEQVTSITKETVFNNIDLLKYITIWGKLYKAELFNNIRFPSGRIYEDAVVAPKLYLEANKMVLVDENLYCRRERGNSITHKMIDLTSIADNLLAFDESITDTIIANYNPKPLLKRLIQLLNYYKSTLDSRELVDNDVYKKICYRLTNYTKFKNSVDYWNH